jgi:hypothetical protein
MIKLSFGCGVNWLIRFSDWGSLQIPFRGSSVSFGRAVCRVASHVS